MAFRQNDLLIRSFTNLKWKTSVQRMPIFKRNTIAQEQITAGKKVIQMKCNVKQTENTSYNTKERIEFV